MLSSAGLVWLGIGVEVLVRTGMGLGLVLSP